tara:strand:+ start:5370 stop:5744 length:375 start_codon:yes stop_codon:yes gene_type:complete
MALSNLNKEVATNLFKMLAIDDKDDKNQIDTVRRHNSSFGQLKLIAEQMLILKEKADQIISNSCLNDNLQKINMTIKKVPGTIYYHYLVNKKEILSIIAPEEWSTWEEYYGKYFYDYDCIFYPQ